MPVAFDHLLFLVLVTLFPVWAVTFGFRRLKRAPPHALPRVRRSVYRAAMISQWVLSATTLGLWWTRGRSWRDLGLGARPTAGIASVVFGLGHAYQGWRGMLLTGVVGAFLAALYLVSGSLITPMIVHALMDMRSGHLAFAALSRAGETSGEAFGGPTGADEPGSVPDRGGVPGPG